MSHSEYKPRLTVDITEEQKRKLSMHLEHGMQKPLFHFIINELIRYFDEYGAHRVIGALIGRHIELKDVLKLDL